MKGAPAYKQHPKLLLVKFLIVFITIHINGLGIRLQVEFLSGEAFSISLLKLNTTLSCYLKQEHCTEKGCSPISWKQELPFQPLSGKLEVCSPLLVITLSAHLPTETDTKRAETLAPISKIGSIHKEHRRVGASTATKRGEYLILMYSAFGMSNLFRYSSSNQPAYLGSFRGGDVPRDTFRESLPVSTIQLLAMESPITPVTVSVQDTSSS